MNPEIKARKGGTLKVRYFFGHVLKTVLDKGTQQKKLGYLCGLWRKRIVGRKCTK
jgi:hypothetical protein